MESGLPALAILKSMSVTDFSRSWAVDFDGGRRKGRSMSCCKVGDGKLDQDGV